MNVTSVLFGLSVAIFLALAGVTRYGVWQIEKRHPPDGEFATVNGVRMHFVHVPADARADLPAIVFIHGASGNLNDPMTGLRATFEGRAEMLFVDRPGHGWSGRGGPENALPDGQAKTIAALMDHLGMNSAIIIGHSFGGAIAAAFAVTQPNKTAGLVLLAAATHPWPGGKTSWYYELTVLPVIGWMFSEALAYPAGSSRLNAATDCVFAPNKAPGNYAQATGISLVLRPESFRNNAADVAGLYPFVLEFSKRYREISVPTVIVSGTRDTVVYEEIHSNGLARDIPGAELVWVRNLGHKPDYIVPKIVAAAVEKAAGRPVELAPLVLAAEERLAGDRYGPIENCPDEKPERLAPQ